MQHGILPTRASTMLDLVFLAMFAVLPVLAWSIYQVRVRRRYLLHKRTQLTLAAVLLLTVGAFEVDMRLHGWRQYVGNQPSSRVDAALWIHLVFAVTTFFLWVGVVVHALRTIPNPPGPSPSSRRHVLLGRLAATDMLLTAVSGWAFYLLAFVW